MALLQLVQQCQASSAAVCSASERRPSSVCVTETANRRRRRVRKLEKRATKIWSPASQLRDTRSPAPRSASVPAVLVRSVAETLGKRPSKMDVYAFVRPLVDRPLGLRPIPHSDVFVCRRSVTSSGVRVLAHARTRPVPTRFRRLPSVFARQAAIASLLGLQPANIAASLGASPGCFFSKSQSFAASLLAQSFAVSPNRRLDWPAAG